MGTFLNKDGVSIFVEWQGSSCVNGVRKVW